MGKRKGRRDLQFPRGVLINKTHTSHDIKVISGEELSPATLQGGIFHLGIRTNTSTLCGSSTKLLPSGEQNLQLNNMPIGM